MTDSYDRVIKRENIPLRHVASRLLLLALEAMLFGLVMYQVRVPQRLNLGAQDSHFLQGFDSSMQDAAAGFRWTNGDGRINLWNLGAAAPLLVRARVSSMRNGNRVPIQFYVNGQRVAEFENGDWETYSFSVPPGVGLTPERLRIRVQSPVFSPADLDPNSADTRELGTAVAWLEVQPLWECGSARCDLTAVFTAPPLAPLLQYVLFAVFTFILLFALGLSLTQTQWIAAGLTVLVGLWLGFSRILAVQYLPALTAWAAALAVMASVSRYAYNERRKQGLKFGLAETLALLIFFLALFIHLNRLIGAFADPGEDGQVYFTGAKQLWSNAPLYDVAAMRTNLFAPVYKIPPFYALLQYPYRSFGIINFLIGFRMVNEVLYLTSLFLLTRIYRVALVSTVGYGLVTIGLLMDPAVDTLRQAQSGLLIVFFITLSLAFLTRKRDDWAGFFLALPFMIKLYPAFLLLPLLLLRRWRALLFFVLTVLGLFGLGVVVAGWEQNWIYLTEVLPLTQGSTAWPENASLFGFLSRFFTDVWEVTDFTTPVLRMVFYFSAAFVTLVSIFVFLRYLGGGEALTGKNWRPWVNRFLTRANAESTESAQWGYALFALTLLIVSPLTWNHYLPTAILAIPAILVFLARGSPPFWILLISVIGIVLLVYGIYPIPLQELDFGAWKQLFVSYRFYALVLLWIVVLYGLWTRVPEK